FHGTAGQAVFITMEAGFNTYLAVVDDTGEPLVDDAGSPNSRIPSEGKVITLPYTGDFFIIANSFQPATGSYSVKLDPDSSCAPTSILFNQTVNNTVDGTGCSVFGGFAYFTDLYTFNGTAGQQISVTMASDQV